MAQIQFKINSAKLDEAVQELARRQKMLTEAQLKNINYGAARIDPHRMPTGTLRQYMLELGFSTATKLSRDGMLRVLEQYPDGPRKG